MDDEEVDATEPEKMATAELTEKQHVTVLNMKEFSSAPVLLRQCEADGCCDNRVHCPFCDIRQYKPAQPHRVKDHLYLTHFQHAVYYVDFMIVKCFHVCRGGSEVRGGHYHCPVCPMTLLKRNAFVNHLQIHAHDKGLDHSVVKAPDAKKPAQVHFEGIQIELCQKSCLETSGSHFHCPLCKKGCDQLTSLTNHMWRCRRQTSKVENSYHGNTAELFAAKLIPRLPHAKEVEEWRWHSSIVRSLLDLQIERCEEAVCCKRLYHCPLCTTHRVKPNHLCHIKQHLVSHWKNGLSYKGYRVLVCNLLCETEPAVPSKKFHFHCPVCGALCQGRKNFPAHLATCDPSYSLGQGSKSDGGGEGAGSPELETDPSAGLQISQHSLLQAALTRRVSADQAELQVAESLADLDRILTNQMQAHNGQTNQMQSHSNSTKQMESFNSETIQAQSFNSLTNEMQSYNGITNPAQPLCSSTNQIESFNSETSQAQCYNSVINQMESSSNELTNQAQSLYTETNQTTRYVEGSQNFQVMQTYFGLENVSATESSVEDCFNQGREIVLSRNANQSSNSAVVLGEHTRDNGNAVSLKMMGENGPETVAQNHPISVLNMSLSEALGGSDPKTVAKKHPTCVSNMSLEEALSGSDCVFSEETEAQGSFVQSTPQQFSQSTVPRPTHGSFLQTFVEQTPENSFFQTAVKQSAEGSFLQTVVEQTAGGSFLQTVVEQTAEGPFLPSTSPQSTGGSFVQTVVGQTESSFLQTVVGQTESSFLQTSDQHSVSNTMQESTTGVRDLILRNSVPQFGSMHGTYYVNTSTMPYTESTVLSSQQTLSVDSSVANCPRSVASHSSSIACPSSVATHSRFVASPSSVATHPSSVVSHASSEASHHPTSSISTAQSKQQAHMEKYSELSKHLLGDFSLSGVQARAGTLCYNASESSSPLPSLSSLVEAPKSTFSSAEAQISSSFTVVSASLSRSVQAPLSTSLSTCLSRSVQAPLPTSLSTSVEAPVSVTCTAEMILATASRNSTPAVTTVSSGSTLGTLASVVASSAVPAAETSYAVPAMSVTPSEIPVVSVIPTTLETTVTVQFPPTVCETSPQAVTQTTTATVQFPPTVCETSPQAVTQTTTATVQFPPTVSETSPQAVTQTTTVGQTLLAALPPPTTETTLPESAGFPQPPAEPQTLPTPPPTVVSLLPPPPPPPPPPSVQPPLTITTDTPVSSTSDTPPQPITELPPPTAATTSKQPPSSNTPMSVTINSEVPQQMTDSQSPPPTEPLPPPTAATISEPPPSSNTPTQVTTNSEVPPQMTDSQSPPGEMTLPPTELEPTTTAAAATTSATTTTTKQPQSSNTPPPVTTTPENELASESPSPAFTVKKRGRPKGSKNKATLKRELLANREQFNPKRLRPDGSNEISNDDKNHPQSLSPVCEKQSVPNSQENTSCYSGRTQQENMNTSFCYSGRTRGKRINFAELAAGISEETDSSSADENELYERSSDTNVPKCVKVPEIGQRQVYEQSSTNSKVKEIGLQHENVRQQSENVETDGVSVNMSAAAESEQGLTSNASASAEGTVNNFCVLSSSTFHSCVQSAVKRGRGRPRKHPEVALRKTSFFETEKAASADTAASSASQINTDAGVVLAEKDFENLKEMDQGQGRENMKEMDQGQGCDRGQGCQETEVGQCRVAVGQGQRSSSNQCMTSEELGQGENLSQNIGQGENSAQTGQGQSSTETDPTQVQDRKEAKSNKKVPKVKDAETSYAPPTKIFHCGGLRRRKKTKVCTEFAVIPTIVIDRIAVKNTHIAGKAAARADMSMEFTDFSTLHIDNEFAESMYPMFEDDDDDDDVGEDALRGNYMEELVTTLQCVPSQSLVNGLENQDGRSSNTQQKERENEYGNRERETESQDNQPQLQNTSSHAVIEKLEDRLTETGNRPKMDSDKRKTDPDSRQTDANNRLKNKLDPENRRTDQENRHTDPENRRTDSTNRHTAPANRQNMDPENRKTDLNNRLKTRLQTLNQKSKSSIQMITNQKKQFASSSLRCPVCKTTFDAYSDLSHHLASQHTNSPQVLCDVCKMVYPTNGALRLHLERKHGPQLEQTTGAGSITCSTCGETCPNAAFYRWHQKVMHKVSRKRSRQTRLKCTMCQYVAVDSWDMTDHRDQHRNQPATCTICRKTLSSEAALKIHVSAKHGNHSFSCHICHKGFAHLRYLRDHLQRHRGEKRHACHICGWRFHQTNTLRAHMDTHKPHSQRSYPYKCPHCPAAYNNRANYLDHLNKHTGAKPHRCGKCGRGFAFRSMLKAHDMFVHSSLRPHGCTECDKRYKTKVQLQQHLITHTIARTGTSPYVCSKCARPLASRSRLRSHAARCKGVNSYKHVLWQQYPQTAHENTGQTVDIISGGQINLGSLLVDLLPGQRIIVHQTVGKDGAITVIPLQNDDSIDSKANINFIPIQNVGESKANFDLIFTQSSDIPDENNHVGDSKANIDLIFTQSSDIPNENSLNKSNIVFSTPTQSSSNHDKTTFEFFSAQNSGSDSKRKLSSVPMQNSFELVTVKGSGDDFDTTNNDASFVFEQQNIGDETSTAAANLVLCGSSTATATTTANFVLCGTSTATATTAATANFVFCGTSIATATAAANANLIFTGTSSSSANLVSSGETSKQVLLPGSTARQGLESNAFTMGKSYAYAVEKQNVAGQISVSAPISSTSDVSDLVSFTGDLDLFSGEQTSASNFVASSSVLLPSASNFVTMSNGSNLVSLSNASMPSMSNFVSLSSASNLVSMPCTSSLVSLSSASNLVSLSSALSSASNFASMASASNLVSMSSASNLVSLSSVSNLVSFSNDPKMLFQQVLNQDGSVTLIPVQTDGHFVGNQAGIVGSDGNGNVSENSNLPFRDSQCVSDSGNHGNSNVTVSGNVVFSENMTASDMRNETSSDKNIAEGETSFLQQMILNPSSINTSTSTEQTCSGSVSGNSLIFSQSQQVENKTISKNSSSLEGGETRSSSSQSTQRPATETASESQNISLLQTLLQSSSQPKDVLQSTALLQSINQPQGLFQSSSQSQSCNQSQALLQGGNQSQALLQSSNQSQPLLQNGSQSQTVSLSSPGAQQVMFTDSRGQTQTLFLPPDLLKQDFVILESSDGQQSILDLSSIRGQQNVLEPKGQQLTLDLNQGQQNALDLQNQHGVVDYQGQRNPLDLQNALDLQNQQNATDLQNLQNALDLQNAVDLQRAFDGQGHQNISHVSNFQREGPVYNYMCSVCNSNFDSMEKAQQHILIQHATSNVEQAPFGLGENDYNDDDGEEMMDLDVV